MIVHVNILQNSIQHDNFSEESHTSLENLSCLNKVLWIIFEENLKISCIQVINPQPLSEIKWIYNYGKLLYPGIVCFLQECVGTYDQLCDWPLSVYCTSSVNDFLPMIRFPSTQLHTDRDMSVAWCTVSLHEGSYLTQIYFRKLIKIFSQVTNIA